MKNAKQVFLKDKKENLNYYEKKEEIIGSIRKIFKSYGFRQVGTPTIEDFSTFLSANSPIISKEIFKIISPTGEIQTLIPDTTIPIAKVIGKNYNLKDKYLKVFYLNQVFRIGRDKGLEEGEFTQAGIEYFGNSTYECDGEVIAIASKVLKTYTKNFRIEIGNSEYYKGLMEEVDIDEKDKTIIKELIEKKNFMDLENVLEKLKLDSSIRKVLSEIPKLYGSVIDVLKIATNLCLNKRMEKAVEELLKVYEVLLDYGYGEYISVDLGLISSLDYYTGTIFTGYISNHGKTILSGGRYDNLTSLYGYSNPASGFGINIDEMIRGINKVNERKEKNHVIDYLAIYTTQERKDAFSISKILREKGFIVESQKLRKNLKEYIENAEESEVSNILFFKGDNLKLIDINKNTYENINIDDFKSKIEDERIMTNFSSIH